MNVTKMWAILLNFFYPIRCMSL